jgi:hypothetical protein
MSSLKEKNKEDEREGLPYRPSKRVGEEENRRGKGHPVGE